jgi:hypothetical protein
VTRPIGYVARSLAHGVPCFSGFRASRASILDGNSRATLENLGFSAHGVRTEPGFRSRVPQVSARRVRSAHRRFGPFSPRVKGHKRRALDLVRPVSAHRRGCTDWPGCSAPSRRALSSGLRARCGPLRRFA